MSYHFFAMFLGFVLDLLFGDPHWLPHPIRLIGNLIASLEKLNKKELSDTKKFLRGFAMVVVVIAWTTGVAAVILEGAYGLHPAIGCAMEAIMTYQILATKCLKVESMKVYEQLQKQDLPAARKAVSMIVGRDTEQLDETGVAKAAIETVAENASDGVIAPMIYLAIGGPVLGFAYKAVNTMDSMVGYKNEKNLYFGRFAAKLDDVVNFIPSRVAALLMIVASFLPGKRFSGTGAWKIWRRDSRKHASPNSAQTESVCAGSLGIQLAGDASYFGKTVKKPTIGDALRPVEPEDIHTAEENIQKILDATNVISDNITHLSATGEEVAASSTEGLRMADSTVDNMKGCKKVLENIYMLAEDMKDSVEHKELG